MRFFGLLAVLALIGACSSSGSAPAPTESGDDDAGTAAPDASSAVDGAITSDATIGDDAAAASDAAGASADGATPCSANGDLGECMTVAACSAKSGYTSFAGYCPGPSSIECCAPTPDVASNPPVPAGWTLMQQSQVTPEMTTWAVAILNDPADYPMFSAATKTFGAQRVMARVEWHPPDFQNAAVHRGVTLYVPTD